MSNDSSKKIILSIIAVLVLIVVVVGISYAVFSYAKKGEVVNSITTGSLIFDFVDGNTINIANHFPIDKETGKALSGENNVCTFTLKASVSDGELTYYIYAVKGDEETGKVRLDDDLVFASITSTDVNGITFTANDNYGDAGSLTNLTTNGVLLGSGVVNARTNVTRQFEVRMWVDNSKVLISDSDDLSGGRKIISTADYENMYYSMRIKITSQKSL